MRQAWAEWAATQVAQVAQAVAAMAAPAEPVVHAQLQAQKSRKSINRRVPELSSFVYACSSAHIRVYDSVVNCCVRVSEQQQCMPSPLFVVC